MSKPEQKEKYIVCINRAGLGNRIKGLISAMRLSRITGRKLLLYWENNQYLGCNFKDLFENDLAQITKKQLKEIKKENSKVYRDVLEDDYNSYKFIIIDTWKFQFLPKEIPEGFSEIYPSEKANNIDFEFNRIPPEIREKLLDELESLRPRKEIVEFVDNFSKENKISECVGLQIRRGDTRFTVDGREKISSDDKFIKVINSLPNERFYLSTDGYNTLLLLKGMFGDRIIAYPEKEIKRSEKESVINGFKAILILARTKHLYGSYLSTFAEMAWWFGGCNNKIDIVGIEDVKNEPKPITFFQKVIWKMKFYKVNFLRWLFRSYG